MKSAEACLCAKLRKVYQKVMAESANLLVYFGDEFGEKLTCESSSGAAALNTGTSVLLSVLMTN